MNKEGYYLTKLECLLILIILVMIDIGPIPITALGLIVILVKRPKWFKQLIDHIYLSKHF